MNKKYSFKNLLENEIIIDFENNKSVIFNKIEIPMIQRDYAQGRGKIEDNHLKLNETGLRFLNTIFHSLENTKEMEMDFVYGSILETECSNNQNKELTFIPLDGQQRLTTLFLLYLYIGTRELVENEYCELMELLKKFTYSTRVSSRRFCELMCETKLSFETNPSNQIRNYFWFFKSYEKDPTIKAMLNMLDIIHEKYVAYSNLFNNLEKLQFYILPLNGFNLTEDLYIKMNARGKQLTDFENFKADFIGWMKNHKVHICSTSPENCKDPKCLPFIEEVDYHNRKMPYYMCISQKMDNEWADMFWQITKDYNTEEKDENGNLVHQSGKLVDPLFMRFFYRYFLNRHIILSKMEVKSIEKENEFMFFSSENIYENFEVFKKFLNINEIKIFEKVFDLISLNWSEINTSISPYWYKSDEKYTFLSNSIKQIPRVVLLGIISYFEKNNLFDNTKFRQWMRVVWNIVENTDISDYSSAIGVMKLLYELSENSSNIYAFLSNPENKLISTSSKIAIDEERLKCTIIYSNNQFNQEWEDSFIKAEQHRFFKGSIGFLINKEMIIKEFLHRTEMAEKVFDEKGINENYCKNGHIFLRALISRYNECNQIVGRNFTDADESEHYLKKMLASDEVVRTATREWFLLSNESELYIKLVDEVNKTSQITGWDTNNSDTQRRTIKVHEDLYKNMDLQNWMQQNKAIRLGWRGDKLYIWRFRSWDNWILLDGYRNEIITKLINVPFSCLTNNQCSSNDNKIKYFWGNEEIKLIRKAKINNEEIEFEYFFDRQFMRIRIRETEDLKGKFSNLEIEEKKDGWICHKDYNYVEMVKQESDIDAFLKEVEDGFKLLRTTLNLEIL